VPKIFIGPFKNTGGVFLVHFQSLTETKLFASSQLCCSIFTLVIIDTIQCVVSFS